MLWSSSSPGCRDAEVKTFTYTGDDQTFTVPDGISLVQVVLWGAGGGGWNGDRSSGAGGYTSGTMEVTAGDTLTIIVGGGGHPNHPSFRSYGGGGKTKQAGASSSGGGGRSAIKAANGGEMATAGGGGGAGNDNEGGAGGGESGSARRS